MRALLSRFWHGWQGIGRYVGDFQSRFLLTSFYFTVLVPFGLIARLLADPLRLADRSASSAWASRQTRDANLAAARRQF